MIRINVQNITGAKMTFIHGTNGPFSTVSILAGDSDVTLFIATLDHFAKASAIADAINAAVAPAQEVAA